MTDDDHASHSSADPADPADPAEYAGPGEYSDPEDRWNAGAAVEDAEHESTSTLSLFDGDTGWLALPQRRALVALMKNRFISAQTHAKDYRALAERPEQIRARLHDMFLELHHDTDRQVAFKRPVATEAGGAPFPTLLHDSSWGREDTIVLVFLRTRFRKEQAAGAERVFVDREDIHDYLTQYRPAHATNVAGDTARVNKAIENIHATGLLIGPKTGDRWQIANAIEPLLPHETLTALLTWLRAENATDGPATEAGSPSADDESRADDESADSTTEADAGYETDTEVAS